MTSQNIRQYLTLTCSQPHPTHILYQCAKFGDDRTSFNVIILRVYFDISGVKSVSHAKSIVILTNFENP